MRNYLGSHYGGSICFCEATSRPAAILSLQIYQTGGPMDVELNRELTGGRGRRCVVKICCSRPIPLTSSFVVKILHWLSSHIHQSPTLNGLELAVDDSRALHMLRRGFKNHCKDSELSSASNARSLAKLNAFPCCARVSQSLGAHPTFALLLPYACSNLM
jgi:hypothetical protein